MDMAILVDKEVVKELDTKKWQVWFQQADRQIVKTDLGNGVLVSTVFLGLDHGYGGMSLWPVGWAPRSLLHLRRRRRRP